MGAIQVEIRIVSGDIGKVGADALIAPINSGGVWFGAIDGVIQRLAGPVYHRQAADQMPLHDGQTVIAKPETVHGGEFIDVVFVIDDLEQPLRNIVSTALKAADGAGYKAVSLPTIRMGVMLGQVEKTQEEAAQEMAEGIKMVIPTLKCINSISIVVFHDPEVEHLLGELLAI
jgi:O-acetyl-ADP-ribose deacetylase (regulator of RNase III)